MSKKKYIGKVATDCVGSTCEFELAEYFADLKDDEKHKALIQEMWMSGMVDVWFEEVEKEIGK